MGREVRMVPPDWEHPKDYRGNYVGLCPHEWADKDDPDYNPSDYMPEWDPSEATYYCMYETCSEGTPISPPCETQEELARWLADNGASSFGSDTATYDEWIRMIKGPGWSITCVITPGVGIESGVGAIAAQEENRNTSEDP